MRLCMLQKMIDQVSNWRPTYFTVVIEFIRKDDKSGL